MTIRDIVKVKDARRVHEIFAGGVAGCPQDYPYLQGYRQACDKCKIGKDMRFDYCDECWSQLYIEGIQQQ